MSALLCEMGGAERQFSPLSDAKHSANQSDHPHDSRSDDIHLVGDPSAIHYTLFIALGGGYLAIHF